MLSRTICSFGQLFCTMQSAGPDLWSWLFRKGKSRKQLLDFTWKIQYMLCWRCQLYTAVSPQLQNAISLEAPMCRATLTSKPSALAKQENHLLNPSSGKDAMINAQGLWAEATATARRPHGSWHRQCQLFHLSKSMVLQPDHFTWCSGYKIKSFCGFHLRFLLGHLSFSLIDAYSICLSLTMQGLVWTGEHRRFLLGFQWHM